MHPVTLYEIARLERERIAREGERRGTLHAARGSIGRPRRRPSARVRDWLRLRPSPALQG
jgi:hypothetical protein